MPRPPAISTIGDIIILAQRLSMKWRSLDFASGRIYADGCGYTLATVEGRGMGLVVSFSRPANVPARPALSPSQAVDKLICGVLPGCPVLVKRDYDFIGDDGEVLGHKVLEAIGIPYATRAAARAFGGYEPYADLCALLSPFLPVLESSAVCYPSARYRWRHDAGAVMHFWEGRMGLLHGFEAWSQSRALEPEVQQAFDHFQHLRSHFESDFVGRWSRAVLHPEDSKEEAKHSATQQLTLACHVIFEFTTGYFAARGFDRVGADGRTVYEALVAMHISIAAKATQECLDNPRPMGEERYPWLGDLECESWVPEAYEVARAYCDTATSPAFLRRYTLHDRRIMTEHIVEAWWILMLRGVAWRMSTWQIAQDKNVPAWCYENKTPVWIM